MSTIRQQLAIKKISENIRKSNSKISLYKIFKEAGYSESVARKPSLVTKTKGWTSITDQSLVNSIETIANLLQAEKLAAYRFPIELIVDITNTVRSLNQSGHKVAYYSKTRKFIYIYIHEPDNAVRLNTLDILYKLKGKYTNKQ